MSPLLRAAATSPRVTAPALMSGRPALVVVAPHPDDETLGCGALLHEATAMGIACRIVCVTDGSASHPNSRTWDQPRLAARRRRELEAAVAEVSPGADLVWLGCRDCDLPAGGPDAALLASRLSSAFAPGALVVAAWGGDPHVDHERTADLVSLALGHRPDIGLLWYPIWGQFQRVPVVPRMMCLAAGAAAGDAKRRALACHASQMTALITDDPEGFVMAAETQAHFLDHPEIFIAA